VIETSFGRIAKLRPAPHGGSHTDRERFEAIPEKWRPETGTRVPISKNAEFRSRAHCRASVWYFLPYVYGDFSGMKKTLHIDDDMLRAAKEACGASTDTETVRLGLEALIRRAAYERLRKLRGSDRGAKDVPRRRPAASRKRTAA
jgi:Arc/MetJ family transcription regulator